MHNHDCPAHAYVFALQMCLQLFRAVNIGHVIAPIPRYNSSYLNGKQQELRYPKQTENIIGSTTNGNASPLKNDDSKSKTNQTKFISSLGVMGRAGVAIMGSNASNSLGFGATTPGSKLLPNSFKTAIEEVEDEINALAAEVAYQRKECQVLLSEQNTITDVAKAQHADIKRYLDRECKILDDCIVKQSNRQCQEFSRLDTGVQQVNSMVCDLDAARMECVRKLIRVQDVLGVKTDPNEAFMQPLQGSVVA